LSALALSRSEGFSSVLGIGFLSDN
jgi:hypothetical protein